MALQDSLPKLLVVDDEPGNLDTFRRVFRKDYAMSFASSAARAYELATRQEFDVALVDYAMPEENGVVFLHRVSTLRPDMACLMMTAHGDLDEVKQAFASGLVQGILMKPWDRETVLRWVANALRLSSLRKTVGAMKASVAKT